MYKIVLLSIYKPEITNMATLHSSEILCYEFNVVRIRMLV
jgi:hypothetical protein